MLVYLKKVSNDLLRESALYCFLMFPRHNLHLNLAVPHLQSIWILQKHNKTKELNLKTKMTCVYIVPFCIHPFCSEAHVRMCNKHNLLDLQNEVILKEFHLHSVKAENYLLAMNKLAFECCIDSSLICFRSIVYFIEWLFFFK